MKKIIALLCLMCILPLSVMAYDMQYPDGYPVLPPELLQTAKTTLNIDDTNGKLLYEKVPISADFNAWMLGWFWDNYKIVVGITDSQNIIYYNYSSLNNAIMPSENKDITKEKGFEIAHNFLMNVTNNASMRFVSSKSYTYNFAEYRGEIRVSGHDATVVVDKLSGRVYYYKGFGDYDANYELLEKLISKDYAYELFFDNIGLELVYFTKYDSISQTKSTKPMYIFNNIEEKAVDAQTGEIRNVTMYDYNYYSNDIYNDSRFSSDNNINTNEAMFFQIDHTGGIDSKAAENKVKNLFYSLRNGYGFYSVYGNYQYYSEKLNENNSYPVWQVNIVPSKYINSAYRFASIYDKNDYDWLQNTETQVEYVFARAYIDAVNGDLLRFDSVPNPNYSYKRPVNFKESDDIPVRVYEFAERAVSNYNKLQLFSTSYENDYTDTYCFARYENNARVIGEGLIFSYNKYTNDITSYCANINLNYFIPLSGVKTISQMSEIIKKEVPFELYYIDKDKNNKIVVYDISDKGAMFDPITGNRIDRLNSNETTKIFICKLASSVYKVNGTEIEYAMPITKNNKIYLPLRLFAAQLGYEISRIDNEIILVSDYDYIKIDLNSDVCLINDKLISIDEMPIIENNLTYMSSLSIGNLFGMHTWWDEASNKIFVVN